MNLSRQGFESGFALVVALAAFNANAAAAPPSPGTQPPPNMTPGPRVFAPPPPPPLQATVSYTQIDIVAGESLATARHSTVALGIRYAPPPVAYVQVPGVLSYAVGPFTSGGFEHTIGNADIRALLRGDEARILERCRLALDASPRDVVETVHDTTFPLTVTGPDGAVFASTNVQYQLGLACKRPLLARIPYTKIQFDINRPLAQAGGGFVPLTLTYNGNRNVASFQAHGAFSYSLGARQGPFEHTFPSADVRALVAPDEAAIRTRCRQALEYNNVAMLDATHDTRIPLTVNGPDGAVVASTTVSYQLGLTCSR